MKYSLSQIIKKKVKKSVSFGELERSEQREVLEYINKNDVHLKVFDKKWFDVLTKKFYAIEYVLDEESGYSVPRETRIFDDFDSFFEYTLGDIYTDSCFYGYPFSEKEIRDYKIDIGRINTKSFIDENIDLYTFESINKSKQSIEFEARKKAKRMEERIANAFPLKHPEYFQLLLGGFLNNYKSIDAKDYFFSLVVRYGGEQIKQTLIDYACTHNDLGDFSFVDVLAYYGPESAQYVIDHLNFPYSESTVSRKKTRYKHILELFVTSNIEIKRISKFDTNSQFYLVADYYFEDRIELFYIHHFFYSFDDFVKYLDGNLCGAHLKNAPVTEEEIKKYSFDEKTTMPVSHNIVKCDVKKYFENNEFVVLQRWVDDNGIVCLKQSHSFEHFFDFISFLKGDLSNANLIMCDGVENIKNIPGLVIDGLKVRSYVAEQLQLPVSPFNCDNSLLTSFDETEKHELATTDNYLSSRPEDDDYSYRVSYITDLHLLHRFTANKCKTNEDTDYILNSIVNLISDQSTNINLIGGDTSSDFNVFKKFITKLSTRRRYQYFFVLGNHELWPFVGQTLDTIINEYKNVLKESNLDNAHLVHNNLFAFTDNGLIEIATDELKTISNEDLRIKMRDAKLIIFGGTGFAGKSDKFNAYNGIYLEAISREEEVYQSNLFLELYEKVTTILFDKNLIVLTHMPMYDWGGEYAKKYVVYVSGHNHRNYFVDDGKKRIYADNQVGYKGKLFSLKQISIDYNYDWFADYPDGIHEISKKDYLKYYRGIGEGISVNKEYEVIYLLKREKTYMFLTKNNKGHLQLFNGGAVKNVGNHTLEYFYENMVNYSKSVSMFLSTYSDYQKEVSSEIKRIGGTGTIHGCIVDIDFYNHIYLNPLDWTATPYFAYSMVDKYVYKSLPTLLKEQCPTIYVNYVKRIGEQEANKQLTIYNQSLPIKGTKTYVDSTEIYKISRIIKGLQFTTKYNVIRIWNDSLLKESSEENGKLIVSNIIEGNAIDKQTK